MEVIENKIVSIESKVDEKKITKNLSKNADQEQAQSSISIDYSFINTLNEVNLTLEKFHREGFLSGEKWDKIYNIGARVIDILDKSVHCECIIDKENQFFQKRSFPLILFENISNMSVGKLILIKIKNKSGSIRIDIYDGENIVDKSAFDLNDRWALLENSGLDIPFDEL